jgi:carbon storage regulator
MLILSRHVGESLILGEGAEAIIVTVMQIRGNQVRIGVAAPPKVRVDREEIRERMNREKAAG